MRIVIVGAGIAGLTLAAALARQGIASTVLEQSQRPQLLGAGMEITPNATRLLLRLGLGDALERMAVQPNSRDVLDWRDGSLLGSLPMGRDFTERFGAPLYTMLRSDLHQSLLAAVPAGTVRSGHYVTDVLDSSDVITLRCADGREVHADMVVAADGVHSVVRASLWPDHQSFSGLSIFRGLASVPFRVGGDSSPRVALWMGEDRHFTCYPVDSGRAVSFNATIPSSHARPESWNAQSRIGDLRASFSGWSSEVLDMISAADWIGVWALHERAPVPEWSKGRVVLTGDAAHPIMPFFNQSVNQSIEDAIALAHCLRSATLGTVESLLQRYAAIRQARAAYVEELSTSLIREMRSAERSRASSAEFLVKRENRKAPDIYGYDVAVEERLLSPTIP
ncbi:FAD-dependent monooxygenase [Nocardiopsis ansamitocini]|uniref:FAD-dependent monooxygenase n=1 Tax=Nocardiopsis ansamitocini TaxID=1670832 RepID=UPI002556DCBB|nr:FAD-dependent monooxygenase [Nocardiopsis ansamitocini]